MMKAKNRKIMLITAVVMVVLAIILAMLFTRCGDHSSATPDQAQVTQATSAATTVKETTAVKSSESETVDATAPTTSKTDPTASVKATEAKPSSSSSSKPDSPSSSSKPSGSGGSSSSKPSSSSSSSSTSSKPSSGGGSSSSSSSSDPHAGKTYHEAVYEDVWVVDQEAYSYEEPVYEERQITVCHVCGAEFDTSYGASNFYAHDDQHLLAGEGSGWHSEVRKVQTGTRTVNVPEEGHWEKKLVKEAGWY